MTDNAAQRSDNVRLAVIVIVFTVFALSLGDALIKKTSAGFVLWQIFVLRSLLALPILVLILRTRLRATRLVPHAIGWTALRSLMLAMMWVLYYASLPHLPLSTAAAAYYTLPIFITLFSAMIVGETIGRLGWVAVFVGFGGVALILKPAAGDFNAYALLPLLSAVLYALSMILTRTKCRDEHPMILALALNVAFVLIGGAATLMLSIFPDMSVEDSFLLGPWTSIGLAELIAVCLLTIAILIGGIGTAVAYQAGPSSVVATFDFAYVGFAALWGLMFFDEAPDALAWLGILMIVGSGILAVRR